MGVNEEDKRKILISIERHIAIAEAHGLRATARSWREVYRAVLERPAMELISSKMPGQIAYSLSLKNLTGVPARAVDSGRDSGKGVA